MDFAWSPEQEALHVRMRELGRELAAAAPDARMDGLARAGALGLCVPKEHGGGGSDLLGAAYGYEGLGAELDDAGVLLAAGAHLFGVAMTIVAVGSETQKERWLPELARGACIATVAATEARAGSDVGATEATVLAQGDGWVANGDKRYVTWGDRAQLFLFLGRGAETRGLTAALVVRAPGVEPGQPLATAGLQGARLTPVGFRDVTLGPDALLGKPGAGMAVFQTAMAYERALVLAFRLGAMQRQLDEAVAFARARRLGGKAIAEHQAVSHRLARMKLRLESARLLVYRAAWLLDRGARAQAEAALAKWQLAEAALESALDAFRLRGGAGFLGDNRFAATIDDALGGTVHSGTSDVLATIVARWLGA